MNQDILPSDYEAFLQSIKARVHQARFQALVAVNKELIFLYWHIGNGIWERQKQQGWGGKVIQQLSNDLCREFPAMKGFSPRNLQYMRTFAEAYPDETQFTQQAVAQIPWGHHCILLDKVRDTKQRLWYIQQTVKSGWSRNILAHQIDANLYHRQGKALTNFMQTLPSPQSDLAQDALKDPYIFDFLMLQRASQEKVLQAALLHHLQNFLLELGMGFTFVGSNYRITVGNRDFYIDLLFYHLDLHCFVVIELKIGEFQPEYAGKVGFYLEAVDKQLKRPTDNPTIGLILCRTSGEKVVAEYALKPLQAPVGVASYQFTTSLPEPLKDQLPDVKRLEASLQEVKENREEE